MLASFERLRVGNALTITQEALRSGHRFELEYILGSFCERTSKKCGHASLFARILHNPLSLRSRSLRPSVNRRVSPADCSPPIRYPAIRPWLAGAKCSSINYIGASSSCCPVQNAPIVGQEDGSLA